MEWSFGTRSDVKTDVTMVDPAIKRHHLCNCTTADGRYTAMTPHAERVFRNIQMSRSPLDSGAHSPWMKLWHNARRWVGRGDLRGCLPQDCVIALRPVVGSSPSLPGRQSLLIQ